MSVCELCEQDGGTVLFRAARYRVVAVEGEEGTLYPGFCRVIWNEHVKEMSDLLSPDRDIFMGAVYRLESVLRTTLSPEKMNLASLGNMTPHLHWHVIPRYRNDAAYPKPIWTIPADVVQTATLKDDKRTVSADAGSDGKAIDWRTAVVRAFSANDAAG